MRLLLSSTTIVSFCWTAAATAATASSSNTNPIPEPPLGDIVDPSAHLFANPAPGSAAAARLRIPTSRESAVLGRRILALSPLGVIATVFPPDDDAEHHRRLPPGIGGAPYGLMEYIADCEEGDGEDIDGRGRGDGRSAGNPTLLAVTMATSFRNIAAGSNVSLAVRWTPRYPPAKRRGRGSGRTGSGDSTTAGGGISAMLARLPLAGRLLSSSSGQEGIECHDHDHHDHHHNHHDSVRPYSAANLPRFSILGYVEPIPGGDDLLGGAAAKDEQKNNHHRHHPKNNETVSARLASCFTAAHPDARRWLPGGPVHESHFVRLVVTHVYWVGGFGDRAYIGWIPAAEWAAVSRDEWRRARLPGEVPGWNEGWDEQEEEAKLEGDL